MVLDNIIATIIQGIIISLTGAAVYTTGHRYFKSFDHTFDSKNQAQVVLVGLVFVTGHFSDDLLGLVQSGMIGLSGLQQLGIVIVTSRLLVNANVPNWTHGDLMTTVQYLVGIVLVASPSISG